MLYSMRVYNNAAAELRKRGDVIEVTLNQYDWYIIIQSLQWAEFSLTPRSTINDLLQDTVRKLIADMFPLGTPLRDWLELPIMERYQHQFNYIVKKLS